MGEHSAIEWTHHTFNPWWGCARVSPGCEHCYAETFARRFGVVWGVKGDRRFFGEKHWGEPLKWNARAAERGERARVFCASMADVFEDRAELVEPRARLGRLIAATPGLDWLLLTKRPQNMVRLGAQIFGGVDAWPANVWAGTTVEDQRRAQERIPELLDVPARVRFLSCEPLLEAVRVDDIAGRGGIGVLKPLAGLRWLPGGDQGMRLDGGYGPRIHWVIAGGESGPHARPMDPAWARSLRDQCDAAGTAFHFKQWGGVLKKATGRVLDGRTWDGFPS